MSSISLLITMIVRRNLMRIKILYYEVNLPLHKYFLNWTELKYVHKFKRYLCRLKTFMFVYNPFYITVSLIPNITFDSYSTAHNRPNGQG